MKNGFISLNRVLEVNSYEVGSSHVSITQWLLLSALTTTVSPSKRVHGLSLCRSVTAASAVTRRRFEESECGER